MDRITTKSLATPLALSDDELNTVSGGALVNIGPITVAPTLITQINTGIQIVIGKGSALQILGNGVV